MLEMYRGDTKVFDIAVTDPDTGGVVDLTGKTLAFMAKRSRTDADGSAVISKTTGAGIANTNAIGGLAALTIDPADTSALAETTQLEYDLQLTNGGQVFTVASDYLLVRADVRRGGP